MKWPSGFLRRVAIFALGLAALVLWLGGQWAARRILVSDELRYIPPGYASLIATGSIAELWPAIDRHFGRIMRDSAHPGPLYEQVHALADKLAQAGVPVASPADLERYGLDIRRGALIVSYQRPKNHLVVVLRTRAGDDVMALAEKLAGEKGTPGEIAGMPVTTFGSYLVARPQPEVLVLSDTPELLRESLTQTHTNRQYWEADDVLYDAVGLLQRRMLSGPLLFFFVPETEDDFVRRASGVIRFRDRMFDVTADVELRPLPWRTVTAFFASPPADDPKLQDLSSQTAAVVTLRDHAISRYIAFLSGFASAEQVIRHRYGQVLWELQRVPGLRRAAVVATGFRDGLPELLLGVTGEAAGVDRMIATLQARFRVQRDRLNGGDVQSPTLSAQEFESSDYKRAYGTSTIRFLLPPITENDVRYRPELATLASLPPAERERFRLAVTRIGDTYWFATDSRDLTRMLDGTPASGRLATEPLYVAASTAWQAHDRLRLFVNMDQAIRLGLLSPESAIQRTAKTYLFQLRDHPAITTTLVSDEARRRIRLVMEFRSRKGLLE